MTNYNMGQMFADAEAAGFAGRDLPFGEYDVKVKRTGVKQATKGERLFVTFESLSGQGTVLDGQNWTPTTEGTEDEIKSAKGSRFHWFRFLANFGLGQEFFAGNPTITPEQIGTVLTQQAESGQAVRIKVYASGNWTNVDILGPATGAPDAPEVAAQAVTAKAPAVAPQPAASVTPAPEAPSAPSTEGAPVPPWQQ